MILLNKKFTFFYSLIFLLNLPVLKAQTHEPVYRELVIELPLVNSDKTLHDVLIGLVAMGGVRYEGYCEQMKCLLLNVNESVYNDNAAIMTRLKELNTAFSIKPTGKISMIKMACKDPQIINTEPTADYLDVHETH